MAHVKTNIYPFWVIVQIICVMLLEVIWSHVLPFKSFVMQSYFQM
jgi:hypothetical protein